MDSDSGWEHLDRARCGSLQASSFGKITFVRSKQRYWVPNQNDFVIDDQNAPKHLDGTPMSICSWYLQYIFGPNIVNADFINMQTHRGDLFLFISDDVELLADVDDAKDENDNNVIVYYKNARGGFEKAQVDKEYPHFLPRGFILQIYEIGQDHVTFAVYTRGQSRHIEHHVTRLKEPLLRELQKLERTREQLKTSVAPVNLAREDMDYGAKLTPEFAMAYGRNAFAVDILTARLQSIREGKPIFAHLGQQYVAPFDQAFEIITSQYGDLEDRESIWLMFTPSTADELSDTQLSQQQTTPVTWWPTVLDLAYVKRQLTEQRLQQDPVLQKWVSTDNDDWYSYQTNSGTFPDPTRNRVSVDLRDMNPVAKRRKM
jgi:hypothetical protein